MTMTVVLHLTPEMEARLHLGILHQDESAVRQVLIEAVEPTIEALLTDAQGEPSPEQAERLLDQMASEAAANLPADWKGLSDYALSRESIYEDHP